MNRIIVASGPVIVEDGKILVNKHGDTDLRKFCGRKVEDFNTGLIENARREAKEEVGIDLEISDPNPFISFTTKETEDGVTDVILVHYPAKRIGEVKPGPEIREWTGYQ